MHYGTCMDASPEAPSRTSYHASKYHAMKILFTSDLHMTFSNCDEILSILQSQLEKCSPDALAISGDISDQHSLNTYGFFTRFDLPVVFCLGNHDFAFDSIEHTHARIRHDREECLSIGAKNAHCLDIEGHFDTHGVRFYGNVLWYDGTLCNRPDRDRWMRKVWDRWLDSQIEDFHPAEEFAGCVSRIKASQDGAPAGQKLVLLTHTVPLRALNAFDAETPDSIPNCYSGTENLFDPYGIRPDLALCGHTHRRAECEFAHPDGRLARCLNSGNDYFHSTGVVSSDVLEI